MNDLSVPTPSLSSLHRLLTRRLDCTNASIGCRKKPSDSGPYDEDCTFTLEYNEAALFWPLRFIFKNLDARYD